MTTATAPCPWNAGKPRRIGLLLCLALAWASVASGASAQPPAHGEKWVATWAASPHGPYPVGNPSAQPELKFALPSPEAGASDQTFRLIVRPDLWGKRIRLRFANTFGTKPITFDALYVGLQATAGTLVDGTNRAVSFEHGKQSVTIPAGQSVFSDAVDLPFVKAAASPDLVGRKLAVSFHVVGSTGPMTWHAKALTTSYLTAPGSGVHSREEGDAAFPFTTASWYFLDAIDVMAPADTAVVAAFGDSITDGTASTLNGDDRWPDVLSRRLHAAYGTHVSVVNQGIGGNQILGPADYSPAKPFAGGPPALQRLDRDIFGLSGLSSIIWMEGINDFGAANASTEAVVAGLKEGVQRMRRHGGIRIFAATLTSCLNSTNGGYGAPEVDSRRKAENDFIRSAGIFDGVVDFDAVTLDRSTGTLRAEFQPNSTVGGPGDLLHPNRAGYQAMGNAIDLKLLIPPGTARQAMAGQSPNP
jgi:lysophospholipase L1-like esterase